MILFADFLFTGGALIMGYAPTIGYLILGRFIVGIGVGAASQIVPLYLSEVAPVEIRGTLVSFSVMISTFAMFAAGLLAYALKPDWRWMLGLAGIPSSLQFIGMFFMPESPRWLGVNDKLLQQRQVLSKIYKPEALEQAHETI